MKRPPGQKTIGAIVAAIAIAAGVCFNILTHGHHNILIRNNASENDKNLDGESAKQFLKGNKQTLDGFDATFR